MAIVGQVRMISALDGAVVPCAVRAISAEVNEDLVNSFFFRTRLFDRAVKCGAFPLVKGDNGRWQILELNEPLRLLVSLDAKFQDLQGNRSTITLVTPGEKDPYMMGFKFEDDGPMELQAEHHDDYGENVLFAPEDDVQVVGSTC